MARCNRFTSPGSHSMIIRHNDTPSSAVAAISMPIDHFFRSLAESHGDGFALILSGGGSDGVIGAKAVKEAGGVVLVQDPREAAHEAMPRAVIAAEIADVVLPVRQLAARLAELARHRESLAPLIRPAMTQASIDEDDEAALKRIFDETRTAASSTSKAVGEALASSQIDEIVDRGRRALALLTDEQRRLLLTHLASTEPQGEDPAVEASPQQPAQEPENGGP